MEDDESEQKQPSNGVLGYQLQQPVAAEVAASVSQPAALAVHGECSAAAHAPSVPTSETTRPVRSDPGCVSRRRQ